MPTYMKLEVFCSDHQVDEIVSSILHPGRTSLPGDGIITVADLPRVVRIRTGEEGDSAL
jgi:nitrogen regulatory protein P-II 1